MSERQAWGSPIGEREGRSPRVHTRYPSGFAQEVRRSPFGGWAGWLVLSFAVCFGGCSAEPSGSTVPGRRHLVLVTVEGLRAEALGAYAPWFADWAAGSDGEAVEASARQTTAEEAWGLAAHTPHLDALAQRSLVYGYALAPSSWCAPSLAGLMASRYPSELGFTDLSEPLTGDAVTLAEVLSGAGWRTRAYVEHPFLLARHNLDQGFADYSLVAGESAKVRSADAVDAAQKAIGKMGAQSTFLWVQLGGLGPPYEEEDGSQALSRRDWMRYRDQWSPQDLEILRALYEREVERVDQEIGALLDTLDRRGLTEDTIVVVTASNGCELLERGMIGDGVSLYADQIRVPLLICVPGERGGSIAEPVSLLDVAPSVLRLVGLSAPAEWRGVSVLPLDPIQTRPLFAELSRARSLRAVLQGDFKLIWDAERERAQLYDIFSDPHEQHDLADQRGAQREEWLAVLRAWNPDAASADSADDGGPR